MSTIGIHKKDIQGIPTLEVVPKEKEDQPLPCVLYFHGFTSAKEHNLPFAYMLAERGFRILLPDSKYHGERYIDMSEKDLQMSFWDIVMQNIEEANSLYTYVQENNLLAQDRIGVAGTSMGGITVSSLLTRYDWIKAVAIFMGTAETTTYANMQLEQIQKEGISIPDEEIKKNIQAIEKTDVSKQINRIGDTPMFMWHGKKDAVIPFSLAESFYATVQENKSDEKLDFHVDPESGHKVSREAFLAGANWFENNL